MLSDLILYSFKELIIKSRRTILTVSAVSVAAIFITILLIVSQNIKLFLFDKIDKDVSNKQIIIIMDMNSELDNITM